MPEQMPEQKRRSRRLDWLTFLPIVAALAGLWGVIIVFTLNERASTLDAAQTQLGFTVATLADANVAAESSASLTPEQISTNRTNAIWRVLLHYPTAHVWLTNAAGEIIAGEAPQQNPSKFISAEEQRGSFAVHALLPQDDALAKWRKRAFLRVAILLVVTLVFSVLAGVLARALRQRVKAEQDAIAALQRLLLRDRALEAITQGITIADVQAPGSPIIYTNPAFAVLTRYTTDEIVGRTPLSFLDRESAGNVTRRMTDAYAEKRPWNIEIELTRKDGTSFLDSMKTSLITSGDMIAYSVTVHEDVTEIRQREELLLEAQKMESIGQLTGGIAHDFNNLLTAIQSNAEELKEDLKDKPILQRQADIVLRAAIRGAGLVSQLMAFARKQELLPQAVDVNGLLDSFTKLVRSTVPAHIRIDVQKAPDLPAVFVDPGRLESALLNLCINSRDAMPQGGAITIETHNAVLDRAYAADHVEVTPGPYVLIAVTDTGGGMPPHVVEKAFTPFFTTKEVGKGTGLGLSMVYGFVKQSGGHAKIYSEVGIGTVIKIYLPAMEHSTAAGSVRKGEAERRGRGSILLVEDDELVSQSISAKLSALGYDILTASTAHEAIETLKRTPHFDLVFSDVIMPGAMSGADLVREVRRRWPNMRVLLTSGYMESSMLGKVNLPTDVKLLSKPYSNADLARSVSEVIGAPMEAHRG